MRHPDIFNAETQRTGRQASSPVTADGPLACRAAGTAACLDSRDGCVPRERSAEKFARQAARTRLAISTLTIAFGSAISFAQEPATPPNPLGVLIETLGKIEAPAAQSNVLRGINTALKSQRSVPAPTGWPELYEKLKTSPSEEVRQQAQTLAATFGAAAALEEMRNALGNPAAGAESRRAALDSLVAARDAQTFPLLLELLSEPGPLRAPALRGLAGFDDKRIPEAIANVFKTLDATEKRDALSTMLARPVSAHALLAAIDAGAIERGEITATAARQLQNLHDPKIDEWLAKNWGAVRTSSAEKQNEIARFKKFLTPELIAKGDPQHGRAIFTQTCAVCHTLFGAGAKIGPELPGSFADVDYLLQNIVDPNAIIGKDYQQTFVTAKDGQVVSGILAGDDAAAVTLKTLAGPVTVPRAEIASLEVSPQSLMPEGLLAALDEQAVRDLFAYLRRKEQSSMLATPSNAGEFFNGNDLARWRASGAGEWKTENGELVGRASGKAPASLESEMAADDFKLSAQIKLSGENAVGEIAFHGGRHAGKFHGRSLSFGGTAPVNLWKYDGRLPPVSLASAVMIEPGAWVACEIAVKGQTLTIVIDGKPAFELSDRDGSGRNGFGFYVAGKGGELRAKDVKLVIEK